MTETEPSQSTLRTKH